MNFGLQASAARLRALRSDLLADYDEEGLHQLRVVLRRMRSALRDTRDGEARELRRALGALARSTNSARDWDTLVTMARQELRTEQFRELQSLLLHRREAARAQVYQMLHSHQWLVTLRLCEHAGDATDAQACRPAVAPAELEHRIRRANAAGHKAMARDDDRSWHKLRIAIKELRYALDSMEDRLQEPASAALLGECKTLQALLGDWHDTVVHRHLLDEMAGQGQLEPAMASARAVSALQESAAARGQRCLEQIKHRLRQADLDLHPTGRTGARTGCC